MSTETISLILSCLLLFPLVFSLIWFLIIAAKEEKASIKLRNEKITLEIKKLKKRIGEW